jgi:hypothetical protein
MINPNFGAIIEEMQSLFSTTPIGNQRILQPSLNGNPVLAKFFARTDWEWKMDKAAQIKNKVKT